MSHRLCVHMDDCRAVTQLSEYLGNFFTETVKKGPPVIVCIGTDRSTGDSLGPLVGWRLSTLLSGWDLLIIGTLDNPVHAENLSEVMKQLTAKEKYCPILAVDACLGQVSPIGSVVIEKTPLYPGTGLKKKLPPVGDLSITGIVNLSGFMEQQLLHTTRLSLVMRLAKIISDSTYLAIRRNYSYLSNSCIHSNL